MTEYVIYRGPKCVVMVEELARVIAHHNLLEIKGVPARIVISVDKPTPEVLESVALARGYCIGRTM